MALRVLVNTVATPEVTFYSDESATSADGPVTVDVVKSDGTVVANDAVTSNVGTGRYRYTLAAQSQMDDLTLTWSGTFSGMAQSITTYVEVVGGFYFTLAELRALPNLSDTNKFTTSELADARRWFETVAERYCGVAFVPRFQRVTLDGTDLAYFQLPDIPVRKVRSVSVDDVALTSTELDALAVSAGGFGYIDRTDGALVTKGYGNVSVAYEYGLDGPPDDLRHAGLVAARHKLLTDLQGTPARELSIANDLGGTTRFSTPSEDRPTGLLEVDAVLASYRDRYWRPGIA